MNPIGVGVVEDRVGGAGAGVVSDEQGGVEAPVDPLHHGAGLRISRGEIGRRVQLLGEQVAHEPVTVVYEDFRRARGERPFNRGVRLGGHEAAEAGILGAERRGGRVGLGFMHHAGDPFHVDRDVDPHGDKPISRVYFVL